LLAVESYDALIPVIAVCALIAETYLFAFTLAESLAPPPVLVICFVVPSSRVKVISNSFAVPVLALT